MDRQADEQVISQLSFKERFPFRSCWLESSNCSDVIRDQRLEIRGVEYCNPEMVSQLNLEFLCDTRGNKELVLTLVYDACGNSFDAIMVALQYPELRARVSGLDVPGAESPQRGRVVFNIRFESLK
jgi:hypothetical protein